MRFTRQALGVLLGCASVQPAPVRKWTHVATSVFGTWFGAGAAGAAPDWLAKELLQDRVKAHKESLVLEPSTHGEMRQLNSKDRVTFADALWRRRDDTKVASANEVIAELFVSVRALSNIQSTTFLDVDEVFTAKEVKSVLARSRAVLVEYARRKGRLYPNTPDRAEMGQRPYPTTSGREETGQLDPTTSDRAKMGQPDPRTLALLRTAEAQEDPSAAARRSGPRFLLRCLRLLDRRAVEKRKEEDQAERRDAMETPKAVSDVAAAAEYLSDHLSKELGTDLLRFLRGGTLHLARGGWMGFKGTLPGKYCDPRPADLEKEGFGLCDFTLLLEDLVAREAHGSVPNAADS